LPAWGRVFPPFSVQLVAILIFHCAALALVVQEAAGPPLDPSFVARKSILLRCGAAFHLCDGGAEARRFNRSPIDAGPIKNL
jgi:hypothetical protein